MPPVDPTDSSMGSGVPGEVTAVAPRLFRFPTASSLLSAPPPVLAPGELSCIRVIQVGEGFIVVGDDSSDAAVKVYTTALPGTVAYAATLPDTPPVRSRIRPHRKRRPPGDGGRELGLPDGACGDGVRLLLLRGQVR